MSKMALFWLVIYFGNLAGGLRHPMYAMVAYMIFYYMPPHLNWWGRGLPDLRYSLLASTVLLGSIILLQSSVEKVKREKNPALAWFVGWGANTVVATAWAINAARSWIYTVLCLKLVLLYALIPAAVRTPAHFNTFAAVHVAGATYWGYKAWDNPKRTAGRLEEVGGPDSQNDNQAAGHLLTVIPFVVLYVLTERRKLPRALYAIGGAFIVNVFILCNSRGATVGLIAAGLTAILLAGKRRRKKLIGVAILSALAVLYLADPEFIERQKTSTDAQDNSALSRQVMWLAGIEIVKAYPFGGGGRTFHILSPQYLPGLWAARLTDRENRATGDLSDAGEASGERSPHNTYIQLATDWGIHGTAIYFVFMFVTIRMLHRIRKRMPDNNWYFYRSLTIEVALAGTMTAAFFSSRLYGESIYWMCALAFALHRMQSTELERVALEAVPALQTAPAPLVPQPAFARQEARRTSEAGAGHMELRERNGFTY